MSIKRPVPSHYGRTPHALLDAGLGLHANAVFQALAYHDGTGKAIKPSLATIGRVAGLSVNSVRNGLQVLVQAGWVEKTETQKGFLVFVKYTLNYELNGRATMSPGDTVTSSASDTVKPPTISNRDAHHVKIDPSTMSPGDSEQEQEQEEVLTRTAQAPLGLRQAIKNHRSTLDVPPTTFSDGYPLEYSLAFAADFVPELYDSEPTDEELAMYATWTREEFEINLDAQRYRIDTEDEEESMTPYAVEKVDQGKLPFADSSESLPRTAAVSTRTTISPRRESRHAADRRRLCETLKSKYPAVRSRLRPDANRPDRLRGNADSC